jgi:hypothetical protein
MDPEPAVEHQRLERGGLIDREFGHCTSHCTWNCTWHCGRSGSSSLRELSGLDPGLSRAFYWTAAAGLLRSISLHAA